MHEYYFTVNNIYFQIAETNNKITSIKFQFANTSQKQTTLYQGLKNTTTKQITEYFTGTRQNFNLPYIFSGTPFQEKIWTAISEIPYGETISYKELASNIGNPSAIRAAANACGRNPLPLLIPCHRVIGSNNTPGGFGFGLKLKYFLLKLEKAEASDFF